MSTITTVSINEKRTKQVNIKMSALLHIAYMKSKQGVKNSVPCGVNYNDLQAILLTKLNHYLKENYCSLLETTPIKESVMEDVKAYLKEKDKIELPSSLIKWENKDDIKIVVISRVSHILSQNKPKQAVQFVEGLKIELSKLNKGDIVLFAIVDGKNKLHTQLFRNLYAYQVFEALKDAYDRGVFVATRERNGMVLPIDLGELTELYSKGICTSILERTEVYDGLFSTKYNSSHYNQFLNWSFGLARRYPQVEFDALLNKYKKICFTKEDYADLDIRLIEAIKCLKVKKELFGLSDIGLITAIEKMTEFNKLIKNFAETSKLKRNECNMKGCKKERFEGKKACKDCINELTK